MKFARTSLLRAVLVFALAGVLAESSNRAYGQVMNADPYTSLDANMGFATAVPSGDNVSGIFQLPTMNFTDGLINIKEGYLRINSVTGKGVGHNDSYVTFGGFVPFGTGNTRVFADAQFRLYGDKNIGDNVGAGVRHYLEDHNRIVGAYVYYDYDDQHVLSRDQISFGVESLGKFLDGRANFYLPSNDSLFDPGRPAVGIPTFQSFTIVNDFSRIGEGAMKGFDSELGGPMPLLSRYGLRSYLGMYHYQGQGEQTWGTSARVEGYIPKVNLGYNVRVTNDELFKTNVTFGAIWYFGRSRRPQQAWRNPNVLVRAQTPDFEEEDRLRRLSIYNRLNDDVYRNPNVTVHRPNIPDFDPLTDLDSGFSFSVIHVDSNGANGNGSFESPFNNLASAQAASSPDDIIFVHSGSSFSGQNFALQTDQRFLGEGITHLINTVEVGTIPLPRANPGDDTLPVISNAPGSGAITLASTTALTPAGQTQVAGFTIVTPTNAGIFGDDDISNAGGSDINVDSVTVTGGAHGISFVATNDTGNTPSINFTNTAISNTTDNAFQIDGGTSTLGNRFDVTYSGSISYEGMGASANGSAVFIINHGDSTAPGTTGTVTFNADSTIRDTRGQGLQFNNANGVYNFLSDDGIAGTFAIDLDNNVNTADAHIGILNNSDGTFAFTTTDIRVRNPMASAPLTIDGDANNLSGTSDAMVTFNGQLEQSAFDTPLVFINDHGSVASVTDIVTFGTDSLLEANSGSGLQFTNADGNYNFFGLSGTATDATFALDLSGGDAGIDILEDSDGIFLFHPMGSPMAAADARIINPTGDAFVVDGTEMGIDVPTGHTPTVIYNGQILNDANHAIVLRNLDTTSSVMFDDQATTTTRISDSAMGVLIDDVDGTVAINTVSMFNGTDGLMIIDDSDGTMTFTNMTIQNTNNSAGFVFSNTTVATATPVINFTGSITQNLVNQPADMTMQRVFEIDGLGGGSITFNDNGLGTDNLTAMSPSMGALIQNSTAGVITVADLNLGINDAETVTSPLMTDALVLQNNGAALDMIFTNLDIQTMAPDAATRARGIFATGNNHAELTVGTATEASGNTISSMGDSAISITDTDAAAAGITFTTVVATGTQGSEGILFNNVDGSGTVTIGTTTLTGITGARAGSLPDALSINQSNADFVFTALTINGTDGDGVNIGLDGGGDNGSGDVTIGGGTITNTTGTAFDINGTTGTITNGASIANTSGLAVEIVGRTGGTATFTAAVTDTAAEGIDILGNSGGSVSFTSTVDLNNSINNALNVGSGNVNVFPFTVTFADLDASTTDGTTTIVGDGQFFPTLNITTGTVSGTSSGAIDLQNMNLGILLTNVVSTSSPDNGISLVNDTGTVTLQSGTISGATQAGLNIDGGSVDVTANTTSGAFTLTSTATAVQVAGGHSGTLLFDTGTTISASVGNGLQFNNADGTYIFSGTTSIGGAAMTAGINIENLSGGDFTFGRNTTLTGIGGTSFEVDNSNANMGNNITFNGSITQNQSGQALFLATGGDQSDVIFTSDGEAAAGVAGRLISSGASIGLQFNDADGSYTFNTDEAVAAAPFAIDLTGAQGVNIENGSGGTFVFGEDMRTQVSGTAFRADSLASSADVTYAGNITNTAGRAIDIENTAAGSQVTFTTGTITDSAAGTGFLFNEADGNVTFTDGGGLRTLSGTQGIQFTGDSDGTFIIHETMVSAIENGPAFNFIGGGSANVTLGDPGAGRTSISQAASQRAVRIGDAGTLGLGAGGTITFAEIVEALPSSTGVIIGMTAGTVNFNELDLGTAGSRLTSDALTLTTNTGTTNFTTLNIFTNNARGFVATNGGTVNMTGTAIVNTMGESAVEVSGLVSGGGGGLTFSSITADTINANTGIILDTVTGSTVTVTTATVNGTTGGTSDGIRITNSSADMNFTTATIASTANVGGDGIELTNNTGAISFGAGSSIGSGTTFTASGSALLVNQGDGNVTYSGTIDNIAGRSVTVSNRTGGTVTVGGSVTDSGPGLGINIASNTGATVNFTGNVDLGFAGTDISGADALSMTGNDAATSVTFSGTSFDIGTTGRRAIFGSGAGSLTISGAGNNFVTTGATGIDITGLSTNITLDTISVSSTTGTNDALRFTNTTGTGFSVTGGTTLSTVGDDAIVIANATGGTFSFAGGTTITGTGGAGVEITGGTATVTFDGGTTMTGITAQGVLISGGTGGNITFNDTTSIQAVAGTANVSALVDVSGNLAGTTISFNNAILDATLSTNTTTRGASLVGNLGTVNFNAITVTGSKMNAVTVNNSTGLVQLSSVAISGTSSGSDGIDITNSDVIVSGGTIDDGTNGIDVGVSTGTRSVQIDGVTIGGSTAPTGTGINLVTFNNNGVVLNAIVTGNTITAGTTGFSALNGQTGGGSPMMSLNLGVTSNGTTISANDASGSPTGYLITNREVQANFILGSAAAVPSGTTTAVINTDNMNLGTVTEAGNLTTIVNPNVVPVPVE